MKEIIETTGKKIRRARREADLTQTELAEKIPVYKTTVSNWETDKYPPDYENLKRLSELLHKGISYFFGETESPTTKVSEPIVKYTASELSELSELRERVRQLEESNIKLEEDRIKSIFNRDETKRIRSKSIQLDAVNTLQDIKLEKLEKKIEELQEKKKALIEQLKMGKKKK